MQAKEIMQKRKKAISNNNKRTYDDIYLCQCGCGRSPRRYNDEIDDE